MSRDAISCLWISLVVAVLVALAPPPSAAQSGFSPADSAVADDVILIPLVITFAGVAMAAPGQMADAVSPAQLNFVRSNAALVERFGAANEALEN